MANIRQEQKVKEQVAKRHGVTIRFGDFARPFVAKDDIQWGLFRDKLYQETGYILGRAAGQKKKHSILETLTSTAVGYVVAILSQLAIFPLFNIHIQLHENLLIGLYFTGISIARGYIFRRIFNALT